MYRIIIGNKAYSSWSLRGWLLVAAFDLPYEEVLYRLYSDEFEEFRKDYAPARTVPLLEWEEDGKPQRVWESLAIAETLAERHPDAGIWPANPKHRVVARIVASEMHAGFSALRGFCPMNVHRGGVHPKRGMDEVQADIARLVELWNWALAETGGPWLGGAAFSAADVFMAPVASRLSSYGLLTPETEPYVTRLLAHPQVSQWIEDGMADPERIARYNEA